jgi:hypothetical protein
VEVELTLALKSDVKGELEGKARFVKASAADETTSKIKLTLEPVDRNGRPTPIGDTDLEAKPPRR